MLKRTTAFVLSAMAVFSLAVPNKATAAGKCYNYSRSEAQSALLDRESDGYHTADNPTSTAYGCGQLLIGARRLYAKRCGTTANTNNVADQMCMMSAYIDDRYGSDERALAFWKRNKWY